MRQGFLVYYRMARTALGLLLGLWLAPSACAPDVLLSAGNLEITPNPAQPGQVVSFSFTLTVVPAQVYSVIVLIDGAEHSRLTRSDAVDGPAVVAVADAAELISRYGAGVHTGAIEVRLHDQNRTAGTAARTFELQNAPAP
jgi:hypothetical protein